VDWVRASATVLAHLSDTVNPQGLVAVCRIPTVALGDVFGGQVALVAILAQVRDPGNAGTVIRVADAAGASGVVLTSASVDAYNPKTVRSSAGSLFHLPVATGVSIETAVQTARDGGLRVLGADGASTTRLDQLGHTTRAAPTAWVFGNEAWGLPDPVRNLCDEVVAIPLYGRAESLNLSTAAAVCLYATALAQHG
jgi:TrmH family RNA methyltransferase